MSDVPELFISACARVDLSLSTPQLETLSRYVEDVLEVNRRMNLTAARDAETVWMRHVFDSLLLMPYLKSDTDQRALDLGSGGGFPGLVLAIVRPDMRWTLVDSVGKKARFLGEEAERLGLENVEASSERAEVLGRDPAYRGQYHVVTARAVARLNVLLELTVPLLRRGGHLLAMKGEKAPEEIKEARRAEDMLKVRRLREDAQPGGGFLLDYKKNAPTPDRYPRAVGVPGQKPL